MSNKQNQKKTKWIQISNFLLGYEKNSLGQVLCVRAVSGQWSIRWGEDTYVYAVLTRLMGDEKCHKYIEALLSLFFAATNYAHDFASVANQNGTPFMNGFTKLMNEQTEYEVSLHDKATEEQNDEALKEVGEMQEIMDELEKLDDENGEEQTVH